MPESSSFDREPPYQNLEEVSLTPLFEVVRAYRRPIGVGFALSLILIASLAIGVYALSPVEREIAIPFRIDMQGVLKGTYPNGTRFSPNDVIAPVVLKRVYEEYRLDAYATLEDFASSFRVEPTTDAKEFRLSTRWSEAIRRIPVELRGTVLNATLAAWARDADLRRGALRLTVPVPGALRLEWDAVAQADYITAVDKLRASVAEVGKDIRHLQALPESGSVRSNSGKVTLAEVELALGTLRSFELEPTVALALSGIAPEDVGRIRVILQGHLWQAEIRRDVARMRAEMIEGTLQRYSVDDLPLRVTLNLPPPAAPPPVGDPKDKRTQFVGELIAQANLEHVKFRQKLADMMLAERVIQAEQQSEVAYREQQLRRLRSGDFRPDRALLEQRIKRTFDRIDWIVAQMSEIYGVLNAQLTPVTALYRVAGPLTDVVTPGLSVRKLVLASVSALIVALVGLIAGALIYQVSRGRSAAPVTAE